MRFSPYRRPVGVLAEVIDDPAPWALGILREPFGERIVLVECNGQGINCAGRGAACTNLRDGQWAARLFEQGVVRLHELG